MCIRDSRHGDDSDTDVGRERFVEIVVELPAICDRRERIGERKTFRAVLGGERAPPTGTLEQQGGYEDESCEYLAGILHAFPSVHQLTP